MRDHLEAEGWHPAMAVARAGAVQREKADLAAAQGRLVSATGGMPFARLATIMGEVERRHAAFEHLQRTTADVYEAPPARRAVESVYADVIAGRL